MHMFSSGLFEELKGKMNCFRLDDIIVIGSFTLTDAAWSFAWSFFSEGVLSRSDRLSWFLQLFSGVFCDEVDLVSSLVLSLKSEWAALCRKRSSVSFFTSVSEVDSSNDSGSSSDSDVASVIWVCWRCFMRVLSNS